MHKKVKKNIAGLVVLLAIVVPGIASADTQIIGTLSDSCATDLSGGYAIVGKFVAQSTATMNQFKLRVSTNGNVKLGIYSDVAGVPTTLLNYTSGNAVVTGWNTFTFPDTALTSGTSYWLGAKSDVQTICYSNSGGTAGYGASTYSDPMPNPMVGITGTSWTIMYQGYNVPAATSSVSDFSGIGIKLATDTASVTYDPAQVIFNGIYLFLLTFFGAIFVIRGTK